MIKYSGKCSGKLNMLLYTFPDLQKHLFLKIILLTVAIDFSVISLMYLFYCLLSF